MEKKLPKELQEQLLSFFENHPPRNFSNSLRRMLIEYIALEPMNGVHIEFHRFLSGVYDLFELLDAAEEWQKKEADKKLKSSEK